MRGRSQRLKELLENAPPTSRRAFLVRSLALGASAPFAASLLAACGGDDDDDDDDGGSDATEPSGSSDATAETPEEETPAADATDAPADDTEAPADGTEEPEGETEEPAGETEEDTAEESVGEGQPGGTLIVAMIGEPPTLDIHQTTGTIVALVTWNIYEPLFSWDDEFAVVPMLAESYEVSDDGLLITVTLRQGVPFHNGAEMVADDVIASIEHWATISGLGESLLAATDESVAVDDYTIEFQMNAPFGSFATVLATASGGCAIYPMSVIEAAAGGEIQEFIGTGPYQFIERQADSHILLERFEDYAALSGEPVGYGGHKFAYLDAIQFVPVPDEAARIAGVQAGDYHFLEDVSPDQHEILSGASGVVSKVLPPSGWGIFILNMRSPIMGDLKVRQAFQAALNLEEIAIAGYGADFFRLSPSLMQEETVWATNAGEELYNLNDPDLARQLLEESGYDGTPIRWTTTQEYQDHFNRSVTAVQQLEDVGFVFDFQVMDWATVLDQQFDDTAWDVTVTGISFDADPTTLFILDVCHVAGWWCTDAVVDLVDQLRSESDFDVRFGIWEEIQQLAYDEVPFVKDGDSSSIQVTTSNLMGLSEQSQIGPILWNTWLEE